MNKQLHDTYLRRGALKGLAQGHGDALSNFEMVSYPMHPGPPDQWVS